MKERINGKTYNTETSKWIGSYGTTRLYQTKTGEYFIYKPKTKEYYRIHLVGGGYGYVMGMDVIKVISEQNAQRVMKFDSFKLNN